MRLLKYIFLSLFALITSSIQAQNSLNGKILELSQDSSFSFLLSGHFYGNSGNLSGYPASSVLANIDEFNNSEAAFLMCLGDLFLDVKNNVPNYEKALFSKLDLPLFNAVGNHDLSGNVYQEHFGETFYSFSTSHHQFVVLDTEKEDGSIEDKQLDLLKKALNSEQDVVFVFSHRPVWAEEDEQLKDVFKQNTSSTFGNNFASEILPLIKQSNKVIYWFSGSLGGNAPASFFYHEKTPKIKYIATAIRDLPRDAYLKVNIHQEKISFETISLTGQKLKPLADYNVELWKNTKPRTFNIRLLPLYVKQTLFSRSFWVGMLVALVLVFFIKELSARRK